MKAAPQVLSAPQPARGAPDDGGSAPKPPEYCHQDEGAPLGLRARWRAWRNGLVARPRFQAWAAAHPLTRRRTRKDGEALFDLVAGFVQAQVLFALVELDLLAALMARPRTAADLAAEHGMAPERMAALLRAAVALDLVERDGAGYQTARRGAAVVGVPGLADMIRHHAVLYRDMGDPVAVLRGDADTELAGFWPYVFGGSVPEDVAARYSELMAESQSMVAAETLAAVDLSDVRQLMDVGGGTGAFLTAAGRAVSGPDLVLFDLPAVVPGAKSRFEAAGLRDRSTIVPGNFRHDPLPEGADAISLVRVLYDHSDDTVASLLGKVFDALPPGGRVIVSEPMTGGDKPTKAGDVYFAFYCMAMRTGRARSPAEISGELQRAGFTDVRERATHRAFVTSVIEARRPVSPR